MLCEKEEEHVMLHNDCAPNTKYNAIDLTREDEVDGRPPLDLELANHQQSGIPAIEWPVAVRARYQQKLQIAMEKKEKVVNVLEHHQPSIDVIDVETLQSIMHLDSMQLCEKYLNLGDDGMMSFREVSHYDVMQLIENVN